MRDLINNIRNLYIQICFISSRLLYTISGTTTTTTMHAH